MESCKVVSKLFVLTCLSLFMVSANALALSDIQVKSYLNQTLDIRIKLIEGEAYGFDDISVKLSSPARGTLSHYQFKHKISKNEDGLFLDIVTNGLIKEPIIEFILDISWPSGRLMREYALLIDQP